MSLSLNVKKSVPVEASSPDTLIRGSALDSARQSPWAATQIASDAARACTG